MGNPLDFEHVLPAKLLHPANEANYVLRKVNISLERSFEC